MIRNQYRITLYDSKFFSELLTYDFPVLPGVGDLIEVENERTMFVVKSRSFKPFYKRVLIPVTLYGNFEQPVEGQHTFEKVRSRIIDEQQQIITSSNGTFEFPNSLD